MTDLFSPHSWNAEQYHLNSSIQYEAAIELLAHIPFKGNETILDIGCGDGKITAKIAKSILKGNIKGIDISAEMIDFAQKKFAKHNFPNLEFSIQNALSLDDQNRFDIVFSSFALQWMQDCSLLFKKIHSSLKPQGYFAATTPLGISFELEHAISTILSKQEWSPYFKAFSHPVQFLTDVQFKGLLEQNSFTLIRFEKLLQEVVFSTRDSFERYVLQWFPYLKPLPNHLRPIIFKKIIDEYLRLIFVEKQKIRFKFPRIDFLSIKKLF